MRAVSIIVAVGLVSMQATGGQLDDLEKKADNKKASSSSSSQPQSRSSDSAASSSFGSGTYPSESGGESFMGSVLAWLVTAPFRYRHDDQETVSLSETDADVDDGEWAKEYSAWFPEHPLGAPTVPYVRADYNWQYINSDLEAEDLRIEVGYKLLAFHGRHTLYTESPTDELTMNQYYGVLRLGGSVTDANLPNASWEAGIGLGVAQQMGEQEQSSGAITVPLKFYPTDWLGVEFRPAWYRWSEKAIGDYDVSTSLGWRYIQIRGGYRWLWMQGEGHLLNGPYAGVSVSF
jgi:hypothetical protein